MIILNVPQFRENEKRRHVFLSAVLLASYTQGQAKRPEVINTAAFKDCYHYSGSLVRVLKLLFTQRLYLIQKRLNTAGMWPRGRRLKVLFKS